MTTMDSQMKHLGNATEFLKQYENVQLGDYDALSALYAQFPTIELLHRGTAGHETLFAEIDKVRSNRRAA